MAAELFPLEKGSLSSAGGGGGMTPPSSDGRIASDSHVLIEWAAYDGSSTIHNIGTAGALDLSLVCTSDAFPALSPYGDWQWQPTPLLSTTQGGVGRTNGTSIGEVSAWTADLWFWMRKAPDSTPGIWPLVGKQDNDGDWTAPKFVAWHASLAPGTGAANTADIGVGIWLIGSIPVLLQAPDVAVGLHHLALTFNGTEAKLYLDGDLVDQADTGAAVDWGTHGGYFVGGVPLTAYSRAWSAAAVSRIRIHGTVRNAAWVAAEWATRRHS